MWRLPSIMELSELKLSVEFPLASITRDYTQKGVAYWTTFYDFTTNKLLFKSLQDTEFFCVVFISTEFRRGKVRWSTSFGPCSYDRIKWILKENAFKLKAEYIETGRKYIYEKK